MFIDYKSLGVRQLGSIYEGLLEFKVRIAQEKMAVVKGKKTEEVIPYQEASKSKKRVLTIGRGHNAQERVYQPGDVYLENDRRERKASGSYYTPDHIVKYIVENTVGPVMAEKFDKLRPKFREAQQDYRKALERAEAFRRQGMKPDDPAKVANTHAGLVDDLFDLKVLDPAMGSGHFLVEAVDFICDRILGEREGFLRAFPWNPVTRFLQDTRDAIVTEMERQGVAVDTGRLTDINLLKRHVLKRCAYGVDLNPMAVELAKVSLWLDCFTIGAPSVLLGPPPQVWQLAHRNHGAGDRSRARQTDQGAHCHPVRRPLPGPPLGHGIHRATAPHPRRHGGGGRAQPQPLRRIRARAGSIQSRAAHLGEPALWQQAGQGVPDLGRRQPCRPDSLRREGVVPRIPGDHHRGKKELAPDQRFFHWDLEFPEAFVDLGRGTWKRKE